MKSKNTSIRRFKLLAVVAAAVLAPTISPALDLTWDGETSGSWIVGTNWVGNPSGTGTPTLGAGSVQTFYATGAANLATFTGSSKVIGTLAFNADADSDVSVRLATTTTGGAVSDLTFDATTGSAAINVDANAAANITLGVSDGSLKLSDNLVITHNGTGLLTINRPIALTTAGSLLGVTKTGSGVLTLSEVNSFDGGLTLTAGTLNINNAGTIGKTGGTFTINGGTIDNTSGATISISTKVHPIIINGDFTFKGTYNLNPGTGAISLGTEPGTTRTITITANTLTLAGAIANGTTANTITKNGTGTLTLNGASTYTGPTTINSGSFSVGALASLTSSVLKVGGSTATGTPALVGQNTINVPTVIAAADGGVAGTQQPGGTSVGTQTFTNSLTYGSGATFAWQVNTGGTGDPGADLDNQGTYDKVVANGATGSVSGGPAVFKISMAGSAFTDPFWDTNKSWSNIFSGTGAPANLAAVFSSFAGTGIAADGVVAGQGQFYFDGPVLKWTPGSAPTNTYANWSAGLANPAFDFDSDGDGIANGLEWILGGNASTNDLTPVLPAVTGDATTGLTLTFTRDEAAIIEATLSVEYATNLAGPWASEVIDQDGGSFPNGVVVTINQVPSPDAVTVHIPATIAVNGRLFARLKAVRN